MSDENDKAKIGRAVGNFKYMIDRANKKDKTDILAQKYFFRLIKNQARFKH